MNEMRFPEIYILAKFLADLHKYFHTGLTTGAKSFSKVEALHETLADYYFFFNVNKKNGFFSQP